MEIQRKIFTKHYRTIINSLHNNLSTNECLFNSYSFRVVHLCIWLALIQKFPFSQEKSFIGRKKKGILLSVVRSIIIWPNHWSLDRLSHSIVKFNTILIFSLFYYKVTELYITKGLKIYLDLKNVPENKVIIHNFENINWFDIRSFDTFISFWKL